MSNNYVNFNTQYTPNTRTQNTLLIHRLKVGISGLAISDP